MKNKSSPSLTVGEGNLPRFAFPKTDFHPSAHLDDAAQDIQDMRNCYNGLLSAAAATANCAFEFSESLREMGSCLLEKAALHHDADAETCEVLSMLGKVQSELQKLVDNYRHHIIETITNPSESLLNNLNTVEDMKRLCDEKRNIYKDMVRQQKEKGRLKGETSTPQQLQTAYDEYNEEATLCVFRLKSLKQGQSRSLLTQAARHHAAQLNFFRRGLKSLEEVETHVRMITEKQRIDYQFSGLEDDGREDGENGYHTNESGELSFEASEKGFDATTAPSNSMEVNLDKSQEVHVLGREHRLSSYSAPLFPESKFEPPEKVKEMPESSKRKSHTYVLPTPIDSKGTISSRTITSVSHSRPANLSGHTHNLWHSLPLEQKKHEKDSGEGQQGELTTLKAQFVSKESDSSNASMQLPLPSAEGRLPPQQDASSASDAKKTKRKALSGPLTGKQSSTKPVLLPSGPIITAEVPQLPSGILPQLPNPQLLLSRIASPTASPPLELSPGINELHELPRPPAGSLVAKAAKFPGLLSHSAPLGLRSQELSMINSIHSAASSAPAPLPLPPLIVPRSSSIRSSSQRAMALHVSRHLGSAQSQIPFKDAEIASSPPLTPIFFANMKAVPSITEVASPNSQIRD
ncbi:hypothetical protein SLEP1_g48254 [Rubroshorea leprosula]|uniref:BAR domain-containing protein n=1 Tax=Rubroshorea leprosula TaxID=152421 RepID=A0AAV5LT19_9ROSI|nr:hypothetical protein SLEP1_g48254 [Rubroshorea leprosula]